MASIPCCVRPPECHIDYHHFESLRRSVLAIGAFLLLAKSAFQAAALNRMRKEVEIVNKLGLPARQAAQFVRCVIRFKSTITICKGEENFSADSILEVLSANLNRGDRVVLEAVGPDEQEALSELEALLLRFMRMVVNSEKAAHLACRDKQRSVSVHRELELGRKCLSEKSGHFRPAGFEQRIE